VIYLGGLVEESEAGELYDVPLHPYTRALMSAVPVPDPVLEDSREQILLSGDLPSPANPPSGCRFHTRCPWKQDTLCDTERPQLRVVEVEGASASHRVACHWAEQIASGELQPHEVAPEMVSDGFGGRIDVDTSPPPEAYL
jgi:peptide/nickel transport system ATP-binding protein